MLVIQESLLWRLCLALAASYKESRLRRILDDIGDWCNRQIDTSAVLRVLCREGVVARAWPESLLCRVLMAVVNFPGWLLHKLYMAFQATFEDSFFARLAFQIGEETAIAQSWLIMALWIIPYERWNNAYTLMAFSLVLVVVHAGAMRHGGDMRLDI